MLKNVLRRLIPFAVRRWLLHPAIVPNGYREEVAMAESILIMRHEKRGQDDEYWASNLRKYAHILDKGLQCCDCEPGHGRDYYKLACASRDMISGSEMLRDPSVVWAREKIAAYEYLQKTCGNGGKLGPFVSTVCSYDDLIDAIKTRRSIRNFANLALPREAVEKIAEAVNWAPSSCNRQTVKIFIADSSALIKTCLEANSGATCLSGEISCFMSFCADLRVYDMPTELTLPVLDVALGMQNCCLTAHSLGVGMTLLNWTHHDLLQEKQLREALSIPPHYRIVANAALGYPEVGAPPPSRKSARFTYEFPRARA